VSVLTAAQGQMYQDFSAQAPAIDELFVVILATSAGSYLATEAAVCARAGGMKMRVNQSLFSGDQPPMTVSSCPAMPLGSGALRATKTAARCRRGTAV
jgi:PE family